MSDSLSFMPISTSVAARPQSAKIMNLTSPQEVARKPKRDKDKDMELNISNELEKRFYQKNPQISTASEPDKELINSFQTMSLKKTQNKEVVPDNVNYSLKIEQILQVYKVLAALKAHTRIMNLKQKSALTALAKKTNVSEEERKLVDFIYEKQTFKDCLKAVNVLIATLKITTHIRNKSMDLRSSLLSKLKKKLGYIEWVAQFWRVQGKQWSDSIKTDIALNKTTHQKEFKKQGRKLGADWKLLSPAEKDKFHAMARERIQREYDALKA